MYINFFGDFVCKSPTKLHIDSKLKNIIDRAEFNIINLEAPIKTDCSEPLPKSGPNIYQPKESIEWLKNNKLNCIALANNHMMDFGKSSVQKTLSLLNDHKHFGCGEIEDCYKPLILSSERIKVAVFSTTHREFSCAEDYEGYGCAWMSSSNLVKEIMKIRDQVDFIFMYNHGGLEYCNLPLPQYREMYKMWIDMGVDSVIASHPHVPQGWEKYKGKYIVYSLGNFCFEKEDNIYPPYWNDSICVGIKIEKGKVNLNITPLRFIPKDFIMEVNQSDSIIEHLENLNEILTDKNKYTSAILSELKNYINIYRGMYTVSGFTKISPELRFFKDIAREIIKPSKFKNLHHLNIYRCETHRWVMEELLSSKYI